ncbi:hypothetical protein AX16_008390 [Volvariella volvacea WC 439]|nr:hypothetical protein AX16_008390 [Volvariella volvacea WC 439]
MSRPELPNELLLVIAGFLEGDRHSLLVLRALSRWCYDAITPLLLPGPGYELHLSPDSSIRKLWDIPQCFTRNIKHLTVFLDEFSGDVDKLSSYLPEIGKFTGIKELTLRQGMLLEDEERNEHSKVNVYEVLKNTTEGARCHLSRLALEGVTSSTGSVKALQDLFPADSCLRTLTVAPIRTSTPLSKPLELPKFCNLRHITMGPCVGDSPSILDQFWCALKDSGIKLSKLHTGYLSSGLVDYLGSFKGLRALTLWLDMILSSESTTLLDGRTRITGILSQHEASLTKLHITVKLPKLSWKLCNINAEKLSTLVSAFFSEEH